MPRVGDDLDPAQLESFPDLIQRHLRPSGFNVDEHTKKRVASIPQCGMPHYLSTKFISGARTLVSSTATTFTTSLDI